MTGPTDEEIAVAQGLGRAAARANMPVTACPYPREQRALRARWVLAYAGAGGQRGLENLAQAAAGAVKRWWG